MILKKIDSKKAFQLKTDNPKLIMTQIVDNNIALFIKRAEEYHTTDFIIEAFANNKIGKVSDIKFIKKNSIYGETYNGVIVLFESWNMNKRVQTLFNEMTTSPDGTTKFYFDSIHYWIINIHKQKLADYDELPIIDEQLPAEDKVKKLEELVKTMTIQLYCMEKQLEKTENCLMTLENKETYHHLINVELRSQLEFKEIEQKWIKDEHEHEMRQMQDEYEDQLQKLREENERLRCNMAVDAIKLTKKDIIIESLQEELRDNLCIIKYMERQEQEKLIL